MSAPQIQTIDGSALAARLAETSPDNETPREGYALVNVLDPDDYEREHIPGSTNIPAGDEERFEARFSQEKEIIVYCASRQCDASERAARELARRGFRRVYEYAGGTSEWRESNRPVKGTAAAEPD